MLALLQLVAGVARLSARRGARRAARLSGLLLGALVLALIGLTCLAVALWIVLARLMDPALAALVMAGLAFGMAAVLLLLARAPANPRPGLIDPEAQKLLAALRAGRGDVGLWAPLVLAGLAALLLASRKPPR